MDRFPRLFSISSQRDLVISECEFWDGYSWNWNILWRREFFEWEYILLSELQAVLLQVALSSNVSNRTIWKFNNNGVFSIESFASLVFAKQDILTENQHVFSNLWRGFAPPRVEMMAWFALLGRLTTMDRLKKCGILQHNSGSCISCKQDEESGNHLFLLCGKVWKVWGVCISWFGISWVVPKDLRSMFEAWFVADIRGLR